MYGEYKNDENQKEREVRPIRLEIVQTAEQKESS